METSLPLLERELAAWIEAQRAAGRRDDAERVVGRTRRPAFEFGREK